jgi:hypothetical protein
MLEPHHFGSYYLKSLAEKLAKFPHTDGTRMMIELGSYKG